MAFIDPRNNLMRKQNHVNVLIALHRLIQIISLSFRTLFTRICPFIAFWLQMSAPVHVTHLPWTLDRWRLFSRLFKLSLILRLIIFVQPNESGHFWENCKIQLLLGPSIRVRCNFCTSQLLQYHLTLWQSGVPYWSYLCENISPKFGSAQ